MQQQAGFWHTVACGVLTVDSKISCKTRELLIVEAHENYYLRTFLGYMSLTNKFKNIFSYTQKVNTTWAHNKK